MATAVLLPSADRPCRTEFIPFAASEARDIPHQPCEAAIADAWESIEGADVLLGLRPSDRAVPADQIPDGEQTCSSLCRGGIPMGDWSLDELYARAEHESRHIGASKRCSPRYRCFGKSMLLVQQ